MREVFLYANGSAGNHGCEALTRSLHQILHKRFQLTLASRNQIEDVAYRLNDIMDVVSLKGNIKKNRLRYILYVLKQHLQYSDERFFELLYRDFFDTVSSDSLYLSIGGDNYAYGYSVWLYVLNKEIERRGGRMALVGCSISDSITDSALKRDLGRFSAIIARESKTYRALQQAVTGVPLYLIPDPAFLLPTRMKPLPEGFISHNTVGVNLSPLVLSDVQTRELIWQNYRNLISYIIQGTDMQVALIPHVVWNTSDDRVPLDVLYEEFGHTGRVVRVSDCNAEELKGYIARCRFLVAARTHASIAAYSSKVPTLVLGYSVKARGIAYDLFNDDANYVVDIRMLRHEDDLLTRFRWICSHEDFIRKWYDDHLDAYTEKITELPNILSCL